MKEMDACDLLLCISRDTFSCFLRQLGHTPETYSYGTPGNGMNVKHKMRIRTTSVNHTGMVGLPKDYLPEYLDALYFMLTESRYSFEPGPRHNVTHHHQ